MKKRFKNSANFWKSLSSGFKFAIVSILVAVFLFGHMAINMSTEEWTIFSVQEEDFDALTEVAYNIIETKDITRPKSDKIVSYNATVYSDGEITISMHTSGVESLEMKLTENFEIIKFEKKNSVFETIMGYILVFLFFGILITGIIKVVSITVKWIYNKCKRNKP